MKRQRLFSLTALICLCSLSSSIAQEPNCSVTGSSTTVQYVNATVNLKILLVQFSDVKCKKTSGNITKFTQGDFEDLLGSDGVYVSPNRYSPDGDALCGSMNDYFRKMSSGNVVIHATLLNQLDEDLGLPSWITLPDTKQNYHTYSATGGFDSDAFYYANANGISIGTLDDHNKLVIIYAGNRYNRYSAIVNGETVWYTGQLNPRADWSGTYYIMSELEDRPMDQEPSGAKFARIGTHCHEFAHTLGIKHSSGSRADLMEAGNKNGNWAAPAPLNPVARAQKGWLTSTVISGQQQFDAYYSLTSPQVFRINSNANGDYFLVENRRYDQTMTIGSTVVSDYNNKDFMPIAWSQNATNVSINEGILVWRVRGSFPSGNYDDNGLVYASGRYGASYPDNNPTETDAGVPFPGTAGVTILSPWSDSRNPYVVEGGDNHYTLYVPNTKSGTNIGMQVLSENLTGGYFTLMLYSSNPPNPALSNQSTLATATSANNQRKLYRESPGTLHEVFESGGEVVYRKSTNNGSTWNVTSQLSNGYGNNSAPCLTMAGSYAIVIWQQLSGTNYNLLFSRSTDGGTTWGPINTLQSYFSCASPGPLPSVSGYANGAVLAVYRTSSSLNYIFSSNSMTGWSGPSSVPGTNGNYNSPSTAINTTYWGTAQGNLAYATDVQSGSPQIQYNYFDFSSSSWSSPFNLSSLLPSNYVGHANPNLAVSSDASYKTVHVVWDATDNFSGPSRVVVHRKGSFRYFGSDYSIIYYQSQNLPSITGLTQDNAWAVFQNSNNSGAWKVQYFYNGSFWGWGYQSYIGAGYNPQISVGSTSAKYLWTSGSLSPYSVNVGSETLNKKEQSSFTYFRELNIFDPSTNVSVTTEIYEPAFVHSIGGKTQVSFSPPAPDSIAKDQDFLARSGETQAFILPTDLDSLKLMFALKGHNASGIFKQGGGFIALVVTDASNGTPQGTLAKLAISSSYDGKRKVYGVSIPSKALSFLAGKSVKVEPLITNVRDDMRLKMSIGHVYSPSPVAEPEEIASPINASTAFDPQQTGVLHSFPNPFNPTTNVAFRVTKAGFVSLKVFDMLGREVASLVDEQKPAGIYQVTFDASNLPSGIYFARLQAGSYVATRKLSLVK